MTTQSNPSLSHDRHVLVREGLRPVTSNSWLAGFNNMLGKELGEWFGTRRWLWQALIWLLVIPGFTAFLLFAIPEIDPTGEEAAVDVPVDGMALTMFYSFAVLAGAIGVIILAQDEVIQEKQSGTAAWVFSKPVARRSFILTKLASNLVGILLFIVGLPALFVIGEIYLKVGHGVPVLPFLLGVGVVLLTLYFYLSLVILLGVLFHQRGPVLGIAFGVLFGGLIAASFVSQIAYILPVSMDKIALAIAQSQPLPGMAISQMIATGALSILFTVLALLFFERNEF